jgi:hypothetical protein
MANCYMDNTLIASDSKEDLLKKTCLVLQKLQDNDLYLKPKKCEFNVTKTDYLGFIIEEGRISMDPIKVKRHRQLACTSYSQAVVILHWIVQLLP